MGENEGVRLVLILCLVALPLRAERVRVVVAVTTPEAGVAPQDIIDSLRTATRVERWGDSPAFVAEIDGDEAEALRRDPRVRAVSMDMQGGGGLLQSIPLVGANLVRAQGIDGRGRTIAVLDTGIDRAHPDFAGRIVGERCFCDNFDGTGCCPGGELERSGDGAAEDDNGHGTHVTGIAVGGGAVAPPGVAPAANIVAVKVLDAANRFRGLTQIYRALEWIADERPDVDAINMSLGTDAMFTPDNCDSTAYALGFAHIVRRLRDRGVLIAASTGNTSATDRMWLPACMQDVLGVGATYDFAGSYGGCSATPDDVTCYTNSSASMDVVAPGTLILSSRRGGGTIEFSGTSMAAPHVAGTILLMKQVGGPSLHPDLIQDLLQRTGKPVIDTRNGLTFPRLDALAAVNATPRAPGVPRRRSARH